MKFQLGNSCFVTETCYRNFPEMLIESIVRLRGAVYSFELLKSCIQTCPVGKYQLVRRMELVKVVAIDIIPVCT